MGLQMTLNKETGVAQVTLDGKVIIKEWDMSERWKYYNTDRKRGDRVEFHVMRRDLPPGQQPDEECERLSDDGSSAVYVDWELYMDTSVGDIMKDFRGYQKEWKESKEYGILVKQLNTVQGTSSPRVTNIVGLATGTFQTDCEKQKRRSIVQLLLILTLREILGEPSKPLPCVIQEPMYSDTDKEFLTPLGLRVVDDPDAFTSIDSGSLVVYMGTPCTVPRFVALETRPAAMFCNDWGNRYISSYALAFPKGWLDPIPTMFNEYRRLHPIESEKSVKKGAFTKLRNDPRFASYDDCEWRQYLVFGAYLFLRKPDPISAESGGEESGVDADERTD